MDLEEKRMFFKIVDLVNELYGYIERKEDENKLAKEPKVNIINLTNEDNDEPERHNPHIEKLMNELKVDFKVEKKEVKDIPPQYKDGSFRKRGKLFEYRFVHSDSKNDEKKIISVYGKTEQECFDKRTQIIAGKRKKAKTKNVNKKQVLMGEWIDEWYNTFKKHKHGEKTQISAEGYIKKICERFGKIPLKNITGIQLQEFINTYNSKPNSRDKLIKMLRAIFKKAELLKLVKDNPCNIVEVATHRYQHYNVLQPAEQNILFEAIDNPKYLRFFKFCCCTGLRMSEALNVKTEDFDQKNSIIYVKGVDTATKKHIRQIPYLPDLIDIPQGKQLFPEITPNSTKLYFKRLFKKLGLKAVIHSFRHTFISCCYHVGFKDKQTQLFAGHTNISMTLDTYTHILKNQTSPIIEYLKRLKDHIDKN